LNFEKIENYLNSYGYPDTINYSKKAVSSPWFVIQHNQNIDSRRKYFSLLNKAHKDGIISDIYFYLYLTRNFQIENNDMHDITSDESQSTKEKIKILLDTLKYEIENREIKNDM